jgi:hypothetical protein
MLASSAKYQSLNSPFVGKLKSLKDQLTVNASWGEPIPQDMASRHLLELKRGVGDVVNTWEPSLKKTAAPIQRRVFQLLNGELDHFAPGADELNQKLSSLIPVQQPCAFPLPSAPQVISRNSGYEKVRSRPDSDGAAPSGTNLPMAAVRRPSNYLPTTDSTEPSRSLA